MKNFIIKHKIPLSLITSGFLTALPLVIPKLGFLQWISLIPMAFALMWMCESEKVRPFRAYGMGLLFFMSYYAVTFHWFFYMYPLDFAGLSNGVSLVVVVLACFGTAFLQAIFSALGFVAFVFVAKTKFMQKRVYLMPVLMASLWVIAEWGQNFGWWGVPWGRLPLGQINFTLLLRSASLFGSYFITFAIVAVNFFIAIAMIKHGIRKMAIVAAASIFVVNLALGVGVTLTYKEEGETYKAAAIQGNISSTEKWNGKTAQVFYIYRDLTIQAASEGAEIVVWPETAIPIVLAERPDYYEAITAVAKDNNVTLIVSLFTRDEETGQLRNSILEINSNGEVNEAVYSKQRLVPFGEFVPMRDFVTAIFPPLADINMLSEDLSAGKESVVIDGEKGKIGCAVCFDSIYEKVLWDASNNGAELFAVSTNDSWFSDSAALAMHNAQSRLRAIENGRYVVRAANTGISSVIDPMGNVDSDLGALERGYIISSVCMRSSTTLYSLIGNVVVYACIAFVLLPPAISLFSKMKKNERKSIKN